MIDWWWVGHIGAIAMGVLVGNTLTLIGQHWWSEFYWKVWSRRRRAGFKP